jgi:hypothetical protein
VERAGGEEGAESLRRSQGPHRAVQSGAGEPRVRDGGRRTGGGRDCGGGLRVPGGGNFAWRRGAKRGLGKPLQMEDAWRVLQSDGRNEKLRLYVTRAPALRVRGTGYSGRAGPAVLFAF